MRTMGFRIDSQKRQKEETVLLPRDFRHAFCTGMTGSGKTASIILPIMEDRVRQGHGILAYTYKGHEHKKIKYIAQKANRLKHVIEIGKPHGRYFNLLSFLETNLLQKVLEELIGRNGLKSDYWSLNAARLGTGIVEILRGIHRVNTLIADAYGKQDSLRTVEFQKKDTDSKAVLYTFPSMEPSFRTLSEIIKTPKSLKKFLQGLPKFVENVLRFLYARNAVTRQHGKTLPLFEETEKEESAAQKISTALLRLDKSIKTYKQYTIDTNSSDGTGNNGILQVLGNAVLALASKDYINVPDIDLFSAIDKGCIVIVDIEGFDASIHGVMLDSILRKLSLRVRNRVFVPVSVFIDEANRVLSSDTDIHNDTLREAKVELILAAQNEEQMIEKFGNVKWSSLRKNFAHSYHIDQQHCLVGNNRSSTLHPIPIIVSEEDMLSAEYAYSRLPRVRKIFENLFIYNKDLPEEFAVDYDPLQFETDFTLKLCSPAGITEAEYVGPLMKNKLKKMMFSYGFWRTKVAEKASSSGADHHIRPHTSSSAGDTTHL